MEYNNKKSIFSKRNIIIGASVLLVLIGLILLFLLPKEKELKIKNSTCSFTYDFGYAISTINMDVEYTDEMVKKVYYNTKTEITMEELKGKIDEIEANIKQTLGASISEKANLKVTRENDSILISYLLDFENFDSNDITLSEYVGFGAINEVEKITIEELRQQVKDMKGTCN